MRALRAIVSGLIVLLLGAASTVHAQEALKNEKAVDDFVVRVMAAVGRGELDEAYSALKLHSTLPANELDAGLQASKEQRNEQFAARYGRPVGYDFISKKKLGKSMLRYVYIEQAEKQPLPWVFHFYFVNKGWVLREFGWDGNASALHMTE